MIEITALNKADEYVEITNNGDQSQDLTGWLLISETGNQECRLASVIEPGETLRIWALAEDAGEGGYNCRFESNIWNNNESDPAVLLDATGQIIDRFDD